MSQLTFAEAEYVIKKRSFIPWRKTEQAPRPKIQQRQNRPPALSIIDHAARPYHAVGLQSQRSGDGGLSLRS